MLNISHRKTLYFSKQEKKPNKPRLKRPVHRNVNWSKTVRVRYIVRGGCSFHIANDETSKLDPGISLTTAKSW